jgi:hypothetical protein
MAVSLMAQMLEVANRAAARLAGGRVLIARGSEQLALDVVFGRDEDLVDDGAGGFVRIDHTNRDFIFPARRYVFGGQISEPQEGDRFTVVEQGENDGQVYEVFPLFAKELSCSCDPQGFLIRVHTKRVAP